MKPITERALLALVFLALLATVAGCTVSDKQLLVVIVEEWARSKNMSPTNEDGSLDPIGLGNAIIGVVTNAVGASTGDDEIDAILNAKKVIDKFTAAEKLIEEGAKERNPAKMDEAIKLRPQDWTYRTKRAALAIEQGDLKTAVSQMDAADAIPKGKRAQRHYVNSAIADLEALKTDGPWKSTDQCWLFYTSLAAKYEALAGLTGKLSDTTQAETYRGMADRCR